MNSVQLLCFRRYSQGRFAKPLHDREKSPKLYFLSWACSVTRLGAHTGSAGLNPVIIVLFCRSAVSCVKHGVYPEAERGSGDPPGLEIAGTEP
jgi:hypothetical protein